MWTTCKKSPFLPFIVCLFLRWTTPVFVVDRLVENLCISGIPIQSKKIRLNKNAKIRE